MSSESLTSLTAADPVVKNCGLAIVREICLALSEGLTVRVILEALVKFALPTCQLKVFLELYILYILRIVKG
jgi:hypothetical protein